MIVVLKPNPNRDQLESLIAWLQEKGIIIHTSIGEAHTILGLVGDTSQLDIDLIAALDIVEDVKRVQEPYKNANRKFHPADTVVKVGDTQIGGGSLTLMAGPCSVESEEQVVAIAKAVKASGATMVRGGFTASTEDLYVGASMILTPDKRTDMRLLETLKAFFLDLGFAGLTFSTPEEHDRIIAFTSQLAHIVSSAYVKSPEAQKRRGFSAGSFQDMTRVARLDEDMWTELFLDDADYLTTELDELIVHLREYADAIRAHDAQALRALLRDGREKKASAGGN